MLRTILGFELRYQFSRGLTWVFVGAFFLMAFFATASDAVLNTGAGGQVHRNAPYVLASALGILTAIGQVFTTAIAGMAVLRDRQMGTEELLFTTRLDRRGYLIGRFLGALAAMLAIFLALPLGLLLGSVMPWNPADRMGPVSVWAVVQPYLVIGIPNLLFVSALFFAVGALTRKAFAVYTAGIVLLVLWQIMIQVVTDLDRLTLAGLLDPFALVTTDVVTRYWSVAEKNTRLLPVAGLLLQNRLLWCAVALGLFGLAYARVRLALQGTGSGAVKPKAAAVEATAVRVVPAVSHRFDSRSHWAMYRSVAVASLRSIASETTFKAIAVVGLLNMLVVAWYAAEVGARQRVWPVASVMAPAVAGGLGIVLIVLVTLYAGELVWRERQQRIDQTYDALPVPLAVTILGKLTGLVLVLLAYVGLAVVAGIAMAAIQGYFRVELGTHLAIVYGTWLMTVVALAAVAVAVHAVVNQKFVGHAVVIGWFVLTQVAVQLGFADRLIRLVNPAPFEYSDMNGFGPFLPRLGVLAGFQLAVAVVLLAVAAMFWQRGTADEWRSRRRTAAARLRTPAVRGALALGLAGAVGFGGFYEYNTRVLNLAGSVKSAEAKQAAFERRYKPFEGMAQPRVVAVDVALDFFPERRAAAWRGVMTAVNRHDRPIDSLYVRLPAGDVRPVDLFGVSSTSGLTYDSLAPDRPAEVLLDDRLNGVVIFRLGTPLVPGDSLSLRYAARYEPRGFPNGAFDHSVAANGSFMNSGYLPDIGYSQGDELADEERRTRQGLGERPRMPSLDDPAGRDRNYISVSTDWMRFAATVSTSPDQIAMAPGYLEREWTEGGRRYFRYVMDAPILGFYAFLSARYEVRREAHGGVQLEVYHHPGHTFALEQMLAASRDGLDYFSREFSPYQFRQYRILEFPRYQLFAQAFPNTIPYSEGIGFIQRLEDGDDAIDFTYFVTAHELAHQWWAHQSPGGFAQGATILTEGLAEYSALVLMERKYGREAAQKFLRQELDGYLRGRGRERKKEVPFLYVENQPYIHYQKGSLVYYALRDYLGEETFHRAVRAYIQKWAFKGPPYATSRDLLAEIRAVTPDSLQPVLTDLFETITLFEHKAESAGAVKRPDGRWDVTLEVKARKLRADSLGVESEIPEADYVDVGVFGERVPGTKLGKPLLVRKLKVTGDTTLVLTVDAEPRKAGIDPYNKLIDRTPEDNVTDVSVR
jgi:ABC-type transport system involved in multi-copper enzyme maturation permease subunit